MKRRAKFQCNCQKYIYLRVCYSFCHLCVVCCCFFFFYILRTKLIVLDFLVFLAWLPRCRVCQSFHTKCHIEQMRTQFSVDESPNFISLFSKLEQWNGLFHVLNFDIALVSFVYNSIFKLEDFKVKIAIRCNYFACCMIMFKVNESLHIQRQQVNLEM